VQGAGTGFDKRKIIVKKWKLWQMPLTGRTYHDILILKKGKGR
jgi:hypothetical protein